MDYRYTRAVPSNSGLAPFKRAALALSVAALSFSAQAGKIGTEIKAYGNGWNLDNVVIVSEDLEGFTYDECCGTYTDPEGESFSYYGNVANTVDGDIFLGRVLAKDWPVGEPPGIKIVHDDAFVKPPKPQNCIMSTSYLEEHFLDSDDPQQVPCSGPFQSHKRYKLAMLPSSVEGGVGHGIDLVFDVEVEEGTRDYQVFQKINNWTGVRLAGFTIEVGSGVGEDFVKASSLDGVGATNLSLSVPADVWPDYRKLANFSTGLFGPVDTSHGRPAGYFDPTTRAGFQIAEYPVEPGNTDTLSSAGTLGSDYADLPPNGGLAAGQFGPWLPNTMLPQGIFWDDDGNPATDAQLMAWYGHNPALPGLGWMTGVAEGFAEIDSSIIEEWGANLTYTMGEIDDLVNVGLNYIVSVGDISGLPDFADAGTATFTLRITPIVDTSDTGAPAYVGATPDPILIFTSSDGVVDVSPGPTFETGALLTARVGDADLNTDSGIAEEVEVMISSTSIPAQALTLVEQGENRGVFAASLPEEFSNVAIGEKVAVTYVDRDDGIGGVDVTNIAETTAVVEGEPPAPVASVSFTSVSVPDSLFVGQARKISAAIENAKEATATVSGEIVITGNAVEVLREPFTDLAPNKKTRVSTTWTAEEEGSVEWAFSVVIDGEPEPVASATATTEVAVNPGKKDENSGPKK